MPRVSFSLATENISSYTSARKEMSSSFSTQWNLLTGMPQAHFQKEHPCKHHPGQVMQKVSRCKENSAWLLLGCKAQLGSSLLGGKAQELQFTEINSLDTRGLWACAPTFPMVCTENKVSLPPQHLCNGMTGK